MKPTLHHKFTGSHNYGEHQLYPATAKLHALFAIDYV